MSKIEWMEIFSGNLRELMKEQEYTQRELSENSGIPESSICRYLKAERIPSATVILNLSYALDCDVVDLIDFGDTID